MLENLMRRVLYEFQAIKSPHEAGVLSVIIFIILLYYVILGTT